MRLKFAGLPLIVLLAVIEAGCAGSTPASPAPLVTISEESEISMTSAGQKEEITVSSSPKETEVPENTSEVSSSSSAVTPAESGYPDASGETDPRLQEILSSLTLEEKVAQMTMPAFDYWDADVEACIKETCPGGVILFEKNCKSKEALSSLTETLVKDSSETAHGLPFLIAIDQEGGLVTRIRFDRDYPVAADVAATGDSENAYKNGLEIGTELRKYNINVNFAPVMDVNSNPANPIIGVRSFSSDPAIVSEYGCKMLAGLKDAGVTGCLKHFPGHGDTSTDSHTGLPRVDKTLEELRALELVPFKAGVDAGAQMIMTAHISFPNIETSKYLSTTGEEITLPATMSHLFLTDILRTEMGFNGVIVTDALEMKAISGHFTLNDATRLIVNAGADLMLIPVRITGPARIQAYRTYIKDFADMVRAGEIDESLIDESVLRILKLKFS